MPGQAQAVHFMFAHRENGTEVEFGTDHTVSAFVVCQFRQLTTLLGTVRRGRTWICDIKREESAILSKIKQFRHQKCERSQGSHGEMRGGKTTSQVCILEINFDSFLENEVELSHSGEQRDKARWNTEQ